MKPVILPLEHYPNNGKHVELCTELPCQITKGEDCFYYTTKAGKEMHTNKNTWYVWYNWQKYEIYPVGFRTPQKAYAYALKEYKKWVGKQMKICQEAKGYLKEMENDNQE